MYGRIYEDPESKEYLERGTIGQQAAQLRSQLRSGISMLRNHDSRFKDQPSHDTEDRICAACSEPGSIESIHHVLLHCPAYARHRAVLRAKIAHVPGLGAEGTPPILTDEDGIVAFLREDFLGVAKEAASAADAFLHNAT